MTKFNGFKIDDVEKAWNYNNKNKYNFSITANFQIEWRYE